MSNFIEILKSVGGGEPCPACEGIGQYDDPKDPCVTCHGTGTVLDLAPLLAKPKELGDVVEELLCKCHIDSDRKFPVMHVNTAMASGYPGLIRVHHYYPMNKSPHYVVGPQRAHSLVYEIARQLGGTCLIISGQDYVRNDLGVLQEVVEGHYNLKSSLPVLEGTIPPDATVLFVTERFDLKEMVEINTACGPARKDLPYLLCLVSDKSEFHVGRNGMPSESIKIVSLHK